MRGSKSSRPFLVIKSQRDMAPGAKRFQTGDVVPETGIYEIVHSPHRLPHQAVLLKDERFPRCAKCDTAVSFEWVSAVERPPGERYRLFELPVLEDDASAQSA